MKRLKRRILPLLLAAIFLSFPNLRANAMGFSAESVYDSVFVITTDTSLGSGFAIGSNSILTNAHVVVHAQWVAAEAFDGTQYSCSVALFDEGLDIALLIIEENVSLTPIPVADNAAIEIGDDAYAIGAPNSMAYTLTKGIVSSKERKIGSDVYIQIDAPLSEGNSGGPLLNDNGEVIGINSRKVSNSEGIGLAIPMTVVCAYLEEQGYSLDDNGNISSSIVQETVQPPSPAPLPLQTEHESSALQEDTSPGLIVTICLSVAFNIILLALLLHERKKVKWKTISSERTDFDIEILE